MTSAWIGPHPHEKNKESAAMAGNPHFMKWCSGHGLTVDLFRQVNIFSVVLVKYFYCNITFAFIGYFSILSNIFKFPSNIF